VKASELIEKVQEMVSKFGDLPIGLHIADVGGGPSFEWREVAGVFGIGDPAQTTEKPERYVLTEFGIDDMVPETDA
jgi:hypothetical protein